MLTVTVARPPRWIALACASVALIGLPACRRDTPPDADPPPPPSATPPASAAPGAPTPLPGTTLASDEIDFDLSASAARRLPSTSAASEIIDASVAGSDPRAVVERFLRDPSDQAKNQAVDRVLKPMCVPPGRSELQMLVAAHLAGATPPEDAGPAERFRRENALFLLKPCLEARLDGPYVDLVVDYHRARTEVGAMRELGELVDRRPALAPELVRWARANVQLPPYSFQCPTGRTVTAWSLLIKLGVLVPGMPVASAIAILGPPSNVDASTGDHVWIVASGCHVLTHLAIETRGGVVVRIER